MQDNSFYRSLDTPGYARDAEPMFVGRSAAGHSKLLDSDYDTYGSGNFESANLLSANLARR